jgi:FdhD protein
VREGKLAIELNGVELIYLLCIPFDLPYLALGFLYTEGILTGKDQIASIELAGDSQTVSVRTRDPGALAGGVFLKRTITSGCGRGVVFRSLLNPARPRVESAFCLGVAELWTLWARIGELDELYRQTRGVHSAALCSRDEVLYFTPDIGRHNTIDRIAGKCVWEDLPVEDKVIVSSGRFSSEMVMKLAALGVPVAIARSAPTDLAVELADEMGLTLASTKGGNKLTVYTHPYRIRA